MSAFSKIIASLREQEGAFHAGPGEDWLQGRTLFGGLSAALAVEASERAFPDLPPLRSAQFAFAGPAEGELRLEPKMLRRGRSAAFLLRGGSDPVDGVAILFMEDPEGLIERLAVYDVSLPRGIP